MCMTITMRFNAINDGYGNTKVAITMANCTPPNQVFIFLVRFYNKEYYVSIQVRIVQVPDLPDRHKMDLHDCNGKWTNSKLVIKKSLPSNMSLHDDRYVYFTRGEQTFFIFIILVAGLQGHI